jgi:hypothetical protein
VTVRRSAPSERISSIGRMIDWKSGIATWRGCSILRPNTSPNGAVVCSRYRCQERLRPPVQLADPIPRFSPCPPAPYAPGMSHEVQDRWKLALGAAAFVVWLAISAATGNASSQRPTHRYTPGYENPAPGDDGTPACPPDGGPVLVPANDAYGLDGNGDGVGCEG